jgi:hypothetical protein
VVLLQGIVVLIVNFANRKHGTNSPNSLIVLVFAVVEDGGCNGGGAEKGTTTG